MKSSTHETPRSILLVDDETLMRHAIRALIEKETDLRVCDDVASESDALLRTEKNRPDLLIVTIATSRGAGIRFLKCAVRRFAKLNIMVLLGEDEISSAERFLRAGALGVVLKQESSAVFMQAIRTVLEGAIYVSESLSKRLLGEILRPGAVQDRFNHKRLSDREIETLHLISRGFGTAEIARKMSVSVHTIETFRARLRKKLHLKTGNDLMKYAIQWARTPHA